MFYHFQRAVTVIPWLVLGFALPAQGQGDDPAGEAWMPLFNGRDLEGWAIKITGHPVGENLNETFVVEKGMLRVRYDRYDTFGTAFGHLYYQEPFSHYKLRFTYRFVGEQLAGGASWNVRNSGVMLHSQSAASNELDQHFPVSVELQTLGGLGAGPRTTANVCTPGTAVAIDGEVDYRHCINSRSATYDGDQWVEVEAVVLGGESMTFIVEGDTVLTFQQPQLTAGFINPGGDDWAAFGIERDAPMWKDRAGEVLTEGYIALQAESHPIDFKDIELLNLKGCMDPKAKNYKAYFVEDDPGKCAY